MRIVFLLALFFLTGCSTKNSCNYHLFELGWKPVSTPPKYLLDDYNSEYFWFVNSNGDFFACPELVSNGVCGNVYKIYIKVNEGEFKPDHIVCMD